jgi:cell division protein FtsI/penicillin-binding protein 2
MAIAGGILCLAPLLLNPDSGARADAAPEELAKVKAGGFSRKVDPPPLTGVNLAALRVQDDGAVAPAHKDRVARLTVDPVLQRHAEKALSNGQIPEAAVVVVEVKTGRILAYANHVERGPRRDVIVEAKAPAASVFKIITGTALVDHARLTPETKQCYWGGEHKLDASNLVDNPEKDKWCATISQAMGRSLNTVFARLALKHLDRDKLGQTARAYGFNQAPVFDVPVAPHTLELPEANLEFARTAAGFWNSTLSPLAAAQLALIVANRGLLVKPYVVDSVTDPRDGLLYKAPARTVLGRAIRAETADAVTVMMESTVSDGTGFKAFHDNAARPYLPNIPVASKTGTLIKQSTDQFYTWFVGFAPSRNPEIAFAVLAVNKTTWRVKANTVARQVLQAYFAARGAPGVSTPKYLSGLQKNPRFLGAAGVNPGCPARWGRALAEAPGSPDGPWSPARQRRPGASKHDPSLPGRGVPVPRSMTPPCPAEASRCLEA